jgi:hypothetical protein
LTSTVSVWLPDEKSSAPAYMLQTAIQADDSANRDLLVSAQSGSGKTVAFGLAMAATPCEALVAELGGGETTPIRHCGPMGDV